MKASVYTEYGPPEVLKIQEVDMPVPRDNEVLVRVFAATVNRTDCAMLRAKPFIMRFFTGMLKPAKTILGTDFAGQVEAVGKEVTSFKVGDRVFGFDDKGLSTHAQYMIIAATGPLSVMPEGLSFEAAAASLEGAHYAYNILNKVKIEPGDEVLVYGATGAIGIATVQLSKYFGATVTAVCNTKNLSLVRSLGADHLVDYLQADFTQTDRKYNFIFDAVGKSSFGKCRPLLKTGGVYISSELGWMAQNIFYALATPVMGGKKVIFPIPSDCKRSILLIKKLTEEGHFKAVIDRKYPLEEIAAAFNYVESGQKTGNVVILL